MKSYRSLLAASLGLVTALVMAACLSLGPTSPEPGEDGRDPGDEETSFQIQGSPAYMA
jgi:hypothetical protein